MSLEFSGRIQTRNFLIDFILMWALEYGSGLSWAFFEVGCHVCRSLFTALKRRINAHAQLLPRPRLRPDPDPGADITPAKSEAVAPLLRQ